MEAYSHLVQYYETDMMGVMHHSNYLRLMEEARTYWFESIGYGYKSFEEMGLKSPVLSAKLDYKKTTTYMDQIDVSIKVLENKGVKLKLCYIMKVKDEVVCIGETVTCFIDENNKPLAYKKVCPELYNKLDEYID